MRLHFLGTRGGIIAQSKQHYLHSSLLISFRRTSILIDWGKDWLSKNVPKVSGILITHAHPDHMSGLSPKVTVPVYATEDSWKVYNKPFSHAHTLHIRQPFLIGPFHIEAFAVNHSLRASAVGYRITAGKRTLFYVSDLISIIDEKDALSNVDLYIGDGAIITRTLLKRVKQGVPVGHTPIIEQLSWCAQYHVPRALFTHCGTEITTGSYTETLQKIRLLGKKVGVNASIVQDGQQLTI